MSKFEKGTSGNPGGRPGGLGAIAALAQTCNITSVFRCNVFIPIKADQSEGYQTLANWRVQLLLVALDKCPQLRMLRWRQTLTHATQPR